MEEVEDFEGFTTDDCDINLKHRTCIEQILKERPSDTSTKIKKKKKRRGWKAKKSTLSPKLLKGQLDLTNLLKFWQLREQHTSDTPHTVLDHAQWFEKVMASFGDNKNMHLTYKHYIKLANLESSVNATMFISDSNEFTSQRLWEQLVHRITCRVSKWWMETTLNLSPLFHVVTHRKAWERTGLKCHTGKNPTSAYPFIHWLGILEQRKVWAGLGPPNQILELRKECIKAILLKYGLLTLEDIAKIICSSFHIPHCPELTELVYQTLSSCKIFHKSQDQEENLANSKHLMDFGPRPSKAKRVPKPSQHYKRAVRTAALYKGLIKGENISDLHLQTDSDEFVGESEITDIVWIPALESEMLDETEGQSWDMIKESKEQTFDKTHHHHSQKRTEHYLLNEEDSYDQFNHNKWKKEKFSWRSSHIQPQEELIGNHKMLPSTSIENVASETCPSPETTVSALEVNQLWDNEEIQESKTLSYKENHGSKLCLGNHSKNDKNESLLHITKDTDSEMPEKNNHNIDSASKNLPVTFDSPCLKSSKQFEDNEDYRCPLFAKTSYRISFTDKIYCHSLPNRVIVVPPAVLGSTKDIDLLTNRRDLLETHPENYSVCTEPKYISDTEASKIHSTRSANRNGYLNMSVGEINPKTSIFENSNMSENENISHLEFQGNVKKDPSTLPDSSAKEHKSSTKPVVSVALSVLTDTAGEKSPERHQNMDITFSTEGNRITFTHISQTNSRSLLNTGNSSMEDSDPTSSSVSTEHSKGAFSKARERRNDTRCHTSLYLDSYRSKIQHHSSTGKVSGNCKSSPTEGLVPEAKQFESYQRNGFSRHQEANGGIEIKNSSQCSITAKNITKMLREFRNDKCLQSCGSVKESPKEKSSPFFVQNITTKESCVIIDLHEQQQKKENVRDAQDGIILQHHQKDETNKLTDLSTCKMLPKISVGNPSTENSPTQVSDADWKLAESHLVNMKRDDSKLWAHSTLYPGYEHSYSLNIKNLPERENITQASGSSDLKCFRAPELISVAEEPSMMRDCRITKVSASTSLRQHKSSSPSVIHTSEAPQTTKHLITTETSKIAKTHNMTQDYSSIKESVDSLLGENGSDKFCSTQGSEMPDMAQQLKMLEVTKESEAHNRIHDNLTTRTTVGTLGTPQVSRSSEPPSVIQDHLKSTTSVGSSVKQNEPNKRCMMQAVETPCRVEHLKATQVNNNSEVSNVIHSHLTSTATVSTVTKENKPNNPGVTKALETVSTVEHLRRLEISSSSEASTVIQDNLTSSTSDSLVPSTSSSNQQMSESNVNSNPLKRQRWKSFKLRDDYEQDFRCKATKINKTRSSYAHYGKPLEKYKEPLLKGWVREIVNRTTVSSSNTKDVYYHTPDGKKLRSSVEIAKYLQENGVVDLTLENFSFFRGWLGFEEPYEVARMAAPKRFSTSSSSPGHNPVMPLQRMSRRHFLPGARNAQSPRATSEDCLIIDKTLPSDRFWVTCFEDIHNSMETDTIEIVNENGELTGYEEWAPDSMSMEDQHITVTNDGNPTSSSESLAAINTTIITSTNDTAATTNTTTTVTAGMNTVNSTTCLPSTFATPSITSTPGSNTAASSITVDCTSVSPLPQSTPACITTTQESMTTTSTIATATAFIITTLASMIPEPHNISTTSSITFRPTSLINTSAGITPMSTSINPMPTNPTVSYASISTQTNSSALPVNNTPAAPKLIPRSSSTNTNITMSSSDITSAISGMSTQDTTSLHYHTHTSPVVAPATHNAIARQPKQFHQPRIFNDYKCLQPKILNVFKPADAQRLFNLLDSPSDSDKLNSSVQKANNRISSPPSHPSENMQNRITATTSSSTQSLIPPGSHEASNEEDKHDFTYIIPNSVMNKDHLTKVRVKSSQLSSLPVSKWWHRTQQSSLSDKDSHLSASVSNNTQQSSTQDIWVRQQQPTSVMGNRQQPDSVLSNTSKEQSALVLGSSSKQQSTSALSNGQHPTPVMRNIQQSTPAEGNMQQHTPVMRYSQQQTSPMRNIQQPSPAERNRQQSIPVMDCWQQQTPVMCNRQQHMPVMGNRQQETSLTENRQHPTPAMSNRHQPSIDIKRKQQPNSVMGNRQKPTLVMRNRRKPTLVMRNRQQQTKAMGNRQQPTPLLGNRQQPTPVMGNRQQSIPVMSNWQQPSPAMGNRQQSSPVITSRQQLPVSVTGSWQYQCPYTRLSEQPTSVTGERQQSSTVIGNKKRATSGFVNTEQSSPFMPNKQQTTPAMCSMQQSTSASIGNHESTQVTDCLHQSTPVMSYKQQSAPVISTVIGMHQSVSVSNCIQQSTPFMSHTQQLMPVTSSSEVMSDKWSLLPISSGQQAVPHSVTISASGQYVESSHHTVMNMNNVCQTPLTTDKIHHVISKNNNVCQTLPSQSLLYKMTPNEAPFQHINVVNHTQQVIPVVNSVPVVSSINNDNCSGTRSSHAGQRSNTAVNTGNHTPVDIKKSKQTARKSTKSTSCKTKPSHHVKLFVDDGILVLEPDSTSVAMSKSASKTDDIIVSEPSSISFKNIPVSLESCLKESIKTLLQLQVETSKEDSPQKFSFHSSPPHGHPYMNTNPKSAIQENHNQQTNNSMTSQFPVVKNNQMINNALGQSALIRPPPPLKVIPTQITRKVNKVTCPPLTPIRQMLSKFPTCNNTTPSLLPTASHQTTLMTPNSSSAHPSLYPLVPSIASLCQTSGSFQNHANLLPSVPSLVPTAASQSHTSPSTSQNSSIIHPSVYVPKPSTASLNRTSTSYS